MLRNYEHRFPEATWHTLKPPGFQYRGSGQAAIKNGWASLRFDHDLARQGFLNQYAMASLEEDFNEIAQGIFGGTADFWQAVDQYDALRKKTRLVIQFYQSLDPLFSELYFRELTSGESDDAQMPPEHGMFKPAQRVQPADAEQLGFEVK